MSSGRKQMGFTIIETMLFLGITGLVMAFMLAGVSTQLNQRRYQDASTALMTYMQNQYNLVSNVSSSRPSSEVCINNQVTTAANPFDNDAGRGTSDCTIVGRILRSANAGKTITATPVVATVDAGVLPLVLGDSDIKILHDARLTQSLTPEEYNPEWGTTLVKPAPNNAQPSAFSILIVRMPTSGQIHTFANASESISLDDLVAVSNLTDFKLCLDPGSLLGAARNPTGILINADAANTSALESVSQGNC